MATRRRSPKKPLPASRRRARAHVVEVEAEASATGTSTVTGGGAAMVDWLNFADPSAPRRGTRKAKQRAGREHFRSYPVPRGKDPLSALTRVEKMENEQGVRVDRSTMSKWRTAERRLARADCQGPPPSRAP
jgi:hypothetical protein